MEGAPGMRKRHTTRVVYCSLYTGTATRECSTTQQRRPLIFDDQQPKASFQQAHNMSHLFIVLHANMNLPAQMQK